MSISVQDNRHSYAPYTRASGQVQVPDVEYQIVPWCLAIDNAAASATGYELNHNGEIDKVEEIRLIAVAGATTDTRRVEIQKKNGERFLRHVRCHATTRMSDELVITPGINYGEGWVVEHSRDARIVIPRDLRVIQRNLDGTAYAGDHRITLMFNVKVHRFQ